MSVRREATAGEDEPGSPRADAEREGDAAAARLSPAAAPRPSARCAWQVLEGQAVILDLEGHKLMGLNPTGSVVWGFLDGRHTLAQIAAAVAEQFEVSVERAVADVTAFVALLSERGLVET